MAEKSGRTTSCIGRGTVAVTACMRPKGAGSRLLLVRQIRGNGQRKVEGTALVDFAICPGAAAMQFDQPFDNGQSQAGATDALGVAGVDTDKAIPDAREIFGRDADALVIDADVQELAIGVFCRGIVQLAHTDGDGAAVG